MFLFRLLITNQLILERSFNKKKTRGKRKKNTVGNIL